MPVGKIIQPSTWIGGTPLSAQWLQNVTDSLNGILPTGVSLYGMHEDFVHKETSADTAGGVVHGRYFQSGALTGTMSTTTDAYAPDANTQGFLSVARGTGTGAFSISFIAPRLAPGLRDFYFSCRFKTKARANLASASIGTTYVGLGLGTGPTVLCNSDLADFWLSNPVGGAAFDSGMSVVDNGYRVFEYARAGNSSTWSVDGTTVLSGIDSTNLSNVTPTIQVYSASLTNFTECVAVDYFNLLIARPVSN